jgi:hypothetical protein
VVDLVSLLAKSVESGHQRKGSAKASHQPAHKKTAPRKRAVSKHAHAPTHHRKSA